MAKATVISIPGTASIRVLSPEAKWWFVLLLLAASAVFTLAAINEPSYFPPGVILPIVGTGLIGAVALIVGPGHVVPGTVRIIPTPSGVRFVPRHQLFPYMIAAGVLFLATAPTIFLPGFHGNRLSSALPFIGLAVLVWELWSLRNPVGLEITPTGLRGVRGCKKIDLSWDELDSMFVVGRRNATLCVTSAHNLVRVWSGYVGGDPAAIKAVTMYFRVHPGQRAQLADGVVAVQLAARQLDEARSQAR